VADRDWVLLAEVDRPRGLRGEVLARFHADDPARLNRIGTVEIVPREGEARRARLEGWKRCGDRVVLKLSGVESVEAANELRGCEIRVARSESPERAPEGRYFAHQLEGLRVVSVGGEALGTVSRVMSPAGQTLLVVEGRRGEFFVPLVAEICVRVDLEGKTIVIDPPDGLVDLNAV
jgi:16S rRNA processing protein RimM